MRQSLASLRLLVCFSVCLSVGLSPSPLRAQEGEFDLHLPTGEEALEALESHLKRPPTERIPLADLSWARAPLSASQVAAVVSQLWIDRLKHLDPARKAQLAAGRVEIGGQVLRFREQTFGAAPPGGRSLWISLHGGGNTAPAVNDEQWANQLQLYQPAEGIYLCPRAPSDTWNLWHRAEVDLLLSRLIEDMIAWRGVDPNRVYLNGYSAGGDGVYQLAPRLSDRFAAAAMMAGHPNDASPLGLRNLPFTIHVGGKDEAYNRSRAAQAFGQRLRDLAWLEGSGYESWTKLYPAKGHWLDLEDAAAFPWMAGHQRDPAPRRVVWAQGGVAHSRLYWLALAPEEALPGAWVVASIEGQRVRLRASPGLTSVRVRLDDRLLNLEWPIFVEREGLQPTLDYRPRRTIGVIAQTLEERGDPRATFSAEVVVPLR